MKSRKFWILSLPALALLGLAGWLFVLPRYSATAATSAAAAIPSGGSGYVLARVERGSLESLVSASGTLGPVSTVSVLARMSGRAERVYADYNDRVAKGQVLLSLDTAMLELQRKEAEAAVTKARAKRDLARLDYENKAALAAKGLLSSYELASGKTDLAVAEAELVQAEASLEIIDTQLGSYALVRSPIDGIVLERQVDAGQSVVEGSSSNASSLFVLTEDLSRMEIEAEVDELDIGGVRPGQPVRFSVDAVPGRSFQGQVRQVRLLPETANNVVSYTVIVDAANSDGLLLPGMTATVDFIKESRADVLLVPNAALRFSPPGLSESEKARKLFLAGLEGLGAEERTAALADFDAAQKAAPGGAETAKQGKSAGLAGMMLPGPPPGMRRNALRQAAGAGAGGTAAANAAAAGTAPERKALWQLDEKGEFQAILVEVGASDGSRTEISGGDELEGREIVVKARI